MLFRRILRLWIKLAKEYKGLFYCGLSLNRKSFKADD